jgi:hypothetical protein
MNKAGWSLILVATLVLVFGVTAEGQQPTKVPRIGYLDNSTAFGSAVRLEAFRRELSKLGWIDKKNITIEYRFAEQKLERLPELAADLVRLKVDLIVASGGPTPLAAKGATSSIPIVMVSATDPVGAGLIASLARPGGNVTGNSGLTPELITKTLTSCTPAAAERRTRGPPTGRAQASGSGTETKIGGDRDSTRHHQFRERLSNRKGEAGGRDYHDPRSALFRRKKADRRACQHIPLPGYLPTEGVCR